MTDKDSSDPLRNLYDFAFGDPEDAFTMPIEQVNEDVTGGGMRPRGSAGQRRVRIVEQRSGDD